MRLGEMQLQCHVFFICESIELYQVQKLGNSWQQPFKQQLFEIVKQPGS